MMKKLIPVLALVALPALAVEPLTSGELISKCSSSGEVRQVCRAWIHGFIGGAFASRTAKPVDADKPETFSERAARTRISRGRAVYGRNYHAGYCLAADTTLDDLVGKLIAYAAGLEQLPAHANQLMLGMLRKNYSCR